MATTVQSTLRKLSTPRRRMPTLTSIENVVTQIKGIAGYGDWSIGVLIVSNSYIKNYNSMYRQQNNVTDILSFANYSLSSPEAFPSQVLENFTNSSTASSEPLLESSVTTNTITTILANNSSLFTDSDEHRGKNQKGILPPNRIRRSEDSGVHAVTEPLLSFPVSSLDRDLGDMIIAPDYIYSKYVKDPFYYAPTNNDLEAIWYRILIHGTVHLLGYDHENTTDTVRMEQKESQIQKLLENSRVKLIIPY